MHDRMSRARNSISLLRTSRSESTRTRLQLHDHYPVRRSTSPRSKRLTRRPRSLLVRNVCCATTLLLQHFNFNSSRTADAWTVEFDRVAHYRDTGYQTSECSAKLFLDRTDLAQINPEVHKPAFCFGSLPPARAASGVATEYNGDGLHLDSSAQAAVENTAGGGGAKDAAAPDLHQQGRENETRKAFSTPPTSASTTVLSREDAAAAAGTPQGQHPLDAKLWRLYDLACKHCAYYLQNEVVLASDYTPNEAAGELPWVQRLERWELRPTLQGCQFDDEMVFLARELFPEVASKLGIAVDILSPLHVAGDMELLNAHNRMSYKAATFSTHVQEQTEVLLESDRSSVMLESDRKFRAYLRQRFRQLNFCGSSFFALWTLVSQWYVVRVSVAYLAQEYVFLDGGTVFPSGGEAFSMMQPWPMSHRMIPLQSNFYGFTRGNCCDPRDCIKWKNRLVLRVKPHSRCGMAFTDTSLVTLCRERFAEKEAKRKLELGRKMVIDEAEEGEAEGDRPDPQVEKEAVVSRVEDFEKEMDARNFREDDVLETSTRREVGQGAPPSRKTEADERELFLDSFRDRCPVQEIPAGEDAADEQSRPPMKRAAEEDDEDDPSLPDAIISDNKYRFRVLRNQCSYESGLWAEPLADRFKCMATSIGVRLHMQPGQTLFEWGSGCGHMGTWFAKYFGVRVFGIDILKEAVDWANLFAAGEFCAYDGNKGFGTQHSEVSGLFSGASPTRSRTLAIPDGTFDYIASCGALIHAERPCAQLRELIGKVRVGGKVWLGCMPLLTVGEQVLTDETGVVRERSRQHARNVNASYASSQLSREEWVNCVADLPYTVFAVQDHILFDADSEQYALEHSFIQEPPWFTMTSEHFSLLLERVG